MIIQEDYDTLRDGTKLVRTYSDTGHYIIREGQEYVDAIDPEDAGRAYKESANMIPDWTPPETEDEKTKEIEKTDETQKTLAERLAAIEELLKIST